MSHHQETLSRAIRGDTDALVSLLEASAPELRRGLAGKISPPLQSLLSIDDVMQECYAEAFLTIGRFCPTDNDSFLRWLTRIAQNNLLDAVRGLQADKRKSDRQRVNPACEDREGVLLDLLAATGTTPTQGARRNEVAAEVRLAMGQLPPAYAAVIFAYDLEERTAAEVASQLGCSPGAVFMRRARGHRLLGELLRKKFGESA